MASPHKNGILYVTMQPRPSLPIAKFHDWYNNEHGPGRLRLDFCENGFRYRANDLADQQGSEEKPEWMAIYDITDMEWLTKDIYTRLRMAPVQSQRERDTMKEIKVGRKFFDFLGEWVGGEFKKLEDVNAEGEGNVMVAVSLTLHGGQDKEEELDKWYKEEHVPMLMKVPGWLRTRRFVTASIEGKDEKEYLALHEYSPENGLGGKEFQDAVSTPWAEKIAKDVVKEKRRRVYDLYYTFGAAPRDLGVLREKDVVPAASTDGLTKTMPTAEWGAIESYVTTKDGVLLPYRLEGSTKPDAPLIVLSNSILVEWGIWDGFVDAFFKVEENRKFRVLRYLTRGRSSNCGEGAITVDVLASDVIALLDALRVPKAAAVIGVSLGGATALNTGLKYPERVAAIVSCDTSAKSPEGNKKTWGERIAVAEKEGAKAKSGETVVGEQLAELTVRRWFVKESYDGGDLEKTIGTVKAMVESNSLEGFKKSVEALYQYDLREEMKSCTVKAAFLVGSGDGVLPGVMKEMAAGYGKSAEYVVIDCAGHLPMVEKPQEFAEVVTKFLGT
jgi:pimeloyl-ACP methyl ester carboxylesterase